MPRLDNPKHELFVKAVVNSKNNGNLSKAYQQVYDPLSKHSAETNSSRLAKRPEVKQRITEVLAGVGLTKEICIAKVAQMTKAQKAMVVDGSIKYVQDNSTQMDSLKVALKLHGLLSNDRLIQDNRSITIALSDKGVDRLDNTLSKLNTLFSSMTTNSTVNEGEILTDDVIDLPSDLNTDLPPNTTPSTDTNTDTV